MTDESRLDQQILKMLEKSIRTCDEATSATEFEHVVSDASDAIEQYNLRILDLLDVRSRANCEMGNYDDALKDALDMMERAPQSIKGYHRAGRVYAAQKEVKEALECYAKGLAIATDRDRMYDIIQLAFDSISDGMEQTVFAWANAGEFRKALRLSERMVDGAPTSPRGYLWAGTIYMMRGMMGKAITYFQRGMDNASRFDHLYIKLKQKRLEAERRRDARMDVILLLPYDILSCVLPYLSTLDLMVCIEVSSLWRERILRCPEAWSCVDITDESVVPILGTIGPYVQQLQARFRSSHGLTALILGGVLPNIRKLELVMVDVPDRKEFMKGLARLRNTLDEVILSMIHVEHTHFPSPTEMLAICPNIKRFVYASNLYPALVLQKSSRSSGARRTWSGSSWTDARPRRCVWPRRTALC
ncbi:hypothetical protein BX666DRAFT_1428700 [Dichotomocladium elegans]|nr:hypothetical protein BX666DRAFT_1428700 [Dichotomocladium elegans]